MIIALSVKTAAADAAPQTAVWSKFYQLGRDLLGYGLCSAVALACDCAILFGLTAAGISYLPAAATGFLAGMVVAYVLSVHFVYRDRRHGDHAWEAFGFFAIGIAGLVINQLLIFGLIDGLHLSLALGKTLTALGVFLFNFAMRRSLLFYTGAQTLKV